MILEGMPQVDAGLVTLGALLVGGIAWAVRLEAKSNSNGRDIDRQEKRQDEHEKRLFDLDNKVMDKLSKIETIVAKIEGQLTAK